MECEGCRYIYEDKYSGIPCCNCRRGKKDYYTADVYDEEHDKREIERLKEMREYYKAHPSFEERWELFMKAMRGEE